MELEPLYCAEQIKVPEGLPEILKEWTKEVIRAQPADVNAWSASCVTNGNDIATATRSLQIICFIPLCRYFAQKLAEYQEKKAQSSK